MPQPRSFSFPQLPARTARAVKWLYFAVSAFLIFLAPYCFPPHGPVYSFSYDFGFNNKIGIAVAIAFICSAPFLWDRHKKWEPVPTISSPDRPSRILLVLALLSHAAGLTYLFFLTQLESGAADLPYFLVRAISMKLHRRPYIDFEYAYGPALLYPTHWLNALGLSIHTSYFVYYSALTLLGIYVAWDFANRLPVQPTVKALTFALMSSISLVVLVITAGINYVLLRFLFPLWTLGLLDDARAKRKGIFRESWIAFVGILLADSISPEMGLALAVASAWFFAFTGYLESSERIRRIAAMAGCLIAHAVVFLALPLQFRDSMRKFGSGGANFPIVPSLMDGLYLFCFAYCARRYVANLRERRLAIPLLLVFSLGSLPGALSHADIGHVALYGLGVYIATIAAAKSDKSKLLWAFVLLPACLLWVSDTRGPNRDKMRLASTALLALCDRAGAEQILQAAGRTLDLSLSRPVDVLRHRRSAFEAHGKMLEREAAFVSKFSSSAEFLSDDYWLMESLSGTNWKPRYYFTVTNVFDAATVAREIEEVRNMNADVLIASNSVSEATFCPSESEEQNTLSRWLLFPYYVSRKHNGCEIYLPYVNYLLDHYRPVPDQPNLWVRKDLAAAAERQ